MAHFYGTLKGNRGEATRMGTEKSGLVTYAAGWQGAIRVEVYTYNGKDMYHICLVPWQGSGGLGHHIATGELNSNPS